MHRSKLPPANQDCQRPAVAFGSGWSYTRYKLITRAVVPLDLTLAPRHDRAFGVLTYHRVASRDEAAPPLTVSPARFRAQLSGLLRRGFRPFALEDLVRRSEAGEPIPRRAFAVVFDDGYQGVATQAFPILAALGVPATVFLPTAFLDQDGPYPFDPWLEAGKDAAQADLWRPLTRDACRRMVQSGWIQLGSHTHWHRDYSHRPQELEQDLRQSLGVLRELGVERPAFSFPFGKVDASLMAVVRQMNLLCCLTTDCQLVRPQDDATSWGRFGAEQYDTPATLAAKLNGWYSWTQNGWRRLKSCLPG